LTNIKAIRGGNLIDGTGAPALEDAVIVVEGSKITAVGAGSEVSIPEGAQIIDASGKTVVPGFIDSHVHFLGIGFRLTQLQLSDSQSIEEIVSDLEEYIKSRGLPEGKWVQGRGWDDQNLTEKRYPNRYDLDAVSPDNPVALTRVCGHMIVLNSRALEACDISKDTPNPDGGVIDKDDQGEPTGVLRDARGLVTREVPPPSYDELRQGLRDAAKLAHSLGITTVHDASRPDESGDHMSTSPYVDARNEDDLKIRAHIMTGYPREMSGDQWLSFGTLKIGVDGSMGAQTALLYEPYENDPSTTGVYVGDKERNRKLAADAHGKKGIVAIHAIGDLAITESLNRIEELQSAEPRDDHRYRIEHYEYPIDEDIERTVEMNVVASMQPNFVGEWGWPGGMYDIRLGEARLATGNPYRRLLDLGIHIPFGSDGMPFHALYGVWSAVNHPISESRITVEEAVQCYTLEGAYATREEDIKGSIESGKLADITILSSDITGPEFKLNTTDPAAIEQAKREQKKTKAYMTILNGEIVYQA
jgi:predicted amidohydrolase YtcJ